jgi:cyanophycin synthetase
VHGGRLVIERQVAGDSYRLLYLDGVLLDAVRRRPPAVLGDGSSTVRALIATENRRRSGRAGRAVVDVIPLDLDCRLTLAASGLRPGSVPAPGRRVVVRGVSNHGSEEDTDGVRGQLGQALVDQGARAAAALGVRLAGVDVITPDPALPLEAAGGVVNEVNTTPGLHFHSQARDPGSRTRVAAAILRVLLEPEASAATPLRGTLTRAAR